MPIVRKSVFITRPPEEVFDYLANFETTAEWDPGVVEATKTSDGPVQLGSTFDLVTNFRGRRVPVTYEVTRYEPFDRVVLVGTNQRFTGIDDIGVSAEGGGTKVSWNANFQMKGIAKLFQPFLSSVFENLSQEAIDGLKKTLA